MTTAETSMEYFAENTYHSYFVLLTARHGPSAVLNLPLVNFIYFFFIEQTQTSLSQLLNDATYDVYSSKAVKTLMC